MAAETTAGPTVPRRQLGRHLRALRNQARLTTKLAAQALEWSEPKLWRIETGQTTLRSLDVEAMCRVYGATAEVTQGLMVLARETKAVGWWHPHDDVIPDWLDLYPGLEEAASRLQRYDPELVPGLLQTADYAREVIRADHPDLGEAEINPAGAGPAGRQALLIRVTAPLSAEVLLGEAVLRRPVGGPQVMAEQLHQLADAAAAAQRHHPGRAVPRRAAPRRAVRPVRDPALPGQRRRAGKRAARRLRRRPHRGALPGKARRDPALPGRLHRHRGGRAGRARLAGPDQRPPWSTRPDRPT